MPNHCRFADFDLSQTEPSDVASARDHNRRCIFTVRCKGTLHCFRRKPAKRRRREIRRIDIKNRYLDDIRLNLTSGREAFCTEIRDLQNVALPKMRLTH